MAERHDESLQALAGLLATAGQPGTAEPINDDLLSAFMEGELEPGSEPHERVLAALAADSALRWRWLQASRLHQGLQRDEGLTRLAGLLATAGPAPDPIAIDDSTLAAFMDGELEPGTPQHDQVLLALATDPDLRWRWLEASRVHAALQRDEDLERIAGLLATAGSAPATVVDDHVLAAFIAGELAADTPAHDQVMAALAADGALRQRWLEASRLHDELAAQAAPSAVSEQSAKILPFQAQVKGAGGGGMGRKRGRWLSSLTALAASVLAVSFMVRQWMAGVDTPGVAQESLVRKAADAPLRVPYGDALVALAQRGVQNLGWEPPLAMSPPPVESSGPRAAPGPSEAPGVSGSRGLAPVGSADQWAWIDGFGAAHASGEPSSLAPAYAFGIQRVATALAVVDPAWARLAARAQRRAEQACAEAQACETAAGLGAWALVTVIHCRAGLNLGPVAELSALPERLLIDTLPQSRPAEWPAPPLAKKQLCQEAERVASLARLEP